MRLVLVYPPPWKWPTEGAPVDPTYGPPAEFQPGDLDGDFYQTPYGLWTLGAEAMRAGHDVKVVNLSAFPWSQVEELFENLRADAFGISCWTANRRGAALVSDQIRRSQPDSLIVVGGPHVTPLAKEWLDHVASTDVVCIGESERTLIDLLARRAEGKSLVGTPGTCTRGPSAANLGPTRDAVRNLDELASVQAQFAPHIFMTSRGCPWSCTFCGAETAWGRGYRAHSVARVVDDLRLLLKRIPVRMIQIKDDTFTTNKRRVIELCRAIREADLKFLWSCDTRVDVLTEEVLLEMRLAGCQRLSLGVESGSQRVLDAVEKKITVAEIEASTTLAKSLGLKVRHYMMVGNQGETRETVDESLRFLHRAQPNEYVFACLSIYPGTKDFKEACARGKVTTKDYFEGKFQELKLPLGDEDDDRDYFEQVFRDHRGLRSIFRESAAGYERILERLGGHHAAHLDLGAALYHEGNFERAREHVQRAIELGFPCPGLALNHLACIAYAQGDLGRMMDHFSEAARIDPQHGVLIENVRRARDWFRSNGPRQRMPLSLEVRHDFELLERTMQPTLPGPLPDTIAAWLPRS